MDPLMFHLALQENDLTNGVHGAEKRTFVWVPALELLNAVRRSRKKHVASRSAVAIGSIGDGETAGCDNKSTNTGRLPTAAQRTVTMRTVHAGSRGRGKLLRLHPAFVRSFRMAVDSGATSVLADKTVQSHKRPLLHIRGAQSIASALIPKGLKLNPSHLLYYVQITREQSQRQIHEVKNDAKAT